MKKLFFLLLIVGLTSCAKEVIDYSFADHFIELRPAKGVAIHTSRLSSNVDSMGYNHLSGIEIVRQATNIYFWNDSIYGHQAAGRGFAESQRDTIKPCLKMYSTDIIHNDGTYASNFVEAYDCVIQRVVNPETPDWVVDTIAYVPNAVLASAAVEIKLALSAEDFDRCYELFDSAFTFVPITGEEWRRLKAQGLE